MLITPLICTWLTWWRGLFTQSSHRLQSSRPISRCSSWWHCITSHSGANATGNCCSHSLGKSLLSCYTSFPSRSARTYLATVYPVLSMWNVIGDRKDAICVHLLSFLIVAFSQIMYPWDSSLLQSILSCFCRAKVIRVSRRNPTISCGAPRCGIQADN